MSNTKMIIQRTRLQDAIDSCKPDKLIQIGGSGSKCILVIEGIADAYLFASPGTLYLRKLQKYFMAGF